MSLSGRSKSFDDDKDVVACDPETMNPVKIDPDAVYTDMQVGALLGFSKKNVREAVQGGKIAFFTNDDDETCVLGSDVLLWLRDLTGKNAT